MGREPGNARGDGERMLWAAAGTGVQYPGPSHPLGNLPGRVPTGASPSSPYLPPAPRALCGPLRARLAWAPAPPLSHLAPPLHSAPPTHRPPRSHLAPAHSPLGPAPSRVPRSDPRESAAAILVGAAASSEALPPRRGGARGPSARPSVPAAAPPRPPVPAAAAWPRAARDPLCAPSASLRSRRGPGARAMLRRPAPAPAPAAWLLLAALLCDCGVWAARGERRGGPGRRGARGRVRRGASAGSRAGMRGSGRGRLGARAAGARGPRAPSWAGRLGPGRPRPQPRGVAARCEGRGRAHARPKGRSR